MIHVHAVKHLCRRVYNIYLGGRVVHTLYVGHLIFHAIFWSNFLPWGISKYQSNVIKCPTVGHTYLWWKAWKSFLPILNTCSSAGCKMVLNSNIPTLGRWCQSNSRGWGNKNRSNAPHMPDLPLGLNIDRCINNINDIIDWKWVYI